jgi:signal transduction histidine kinase
VQVMADRQISQSSSSSFLALVILPSIVLSILITIVILYPNSWVVRDADHFYFEIFAVLLSTIVAIYCIARASLLHENFSLFVGIGFATVAVVDLLHAVFSYYNVGNSIFLDYFIPQTWFAGRTFLGAMLAIAVIKYAVPPTTAGFTAPKQKEKNEENAAISSSTTDDKYDGSSSTTTTIDDGSGPHYLGLHKILLFSLLLFSILAISIVVISFFALFPGIRLADFPIHRPYEIPAVALFLTTLFYFYKKKLYRANDAFYKGILGALIIDIFGQLVMLLSAANFNTAHNVAHILKDSGYFIIIISLAISSVQYNRLARDRENMIRLQYVKLREADKMKDEFINIAAHELRTPIQPVLGMSQLLRARIAEDGHNNNNGDDEEQRQFLDVIIRNAKRLQRLTENILDVTKIESSTFRLKMEGFDLNDVIVSAIDDVIVSSEFLKKQGRIRISYRPKQILVYADKTRLAQVTGNLINNAIKFTAEGNISITAEETSSREEIIIRVQDSGEGIDPDIFPALFTRFTSNSHSSGGTGLGLFISKKIVEAHGGRIWAENNNDGKKGATFTFTLPKHNQSSLLLKENNTTIVNNNNIDRSDYYKKISQMELKE